MKSLSDRKKFLLSLIIEEYIKNADPVGSKFLTGKSKLDLSSATLRNEMAELEKLGYIYQPYTSSGRVPSEKGYRFYIENFLQNKEAGKKEKEAINKAVRKARRERYNIYKSLAKTIAELSPVAVIFAFSKNDLYYTGIANLFSQPEFRNAEIICDISGVIDRLDEVMAEIFDQASAEVDIFLGKENPFGEVCGALIASYKNKKDSRGVIGFLGPMRMDYQTNYSLMKYSKELISAL